MSKLREAPKVDRLDAKPDPKGQARVDREGGRYGAGVITGASLCSRGEALGHYMWVDQVMLQQIVDLSPADPKFLKSRFTHPDWCSDGMGKGLGTIDNLKLVGDQVYGDLHFYAAAHVAPDGDLATYVMNLADEDPVNFGLSIVFSHDWVAEDEFEEEHTKTIEAKDDQGNVVTTRRQFQSPDPNNVENLPHARIAEMRAADVVDEPAANPNGLFHRENEVLQDGGKLIEFILGKSTEAPKLSSALGVDVAPERLKSFVSKYLAKAGLSISQAKDGAMPDPTKKPTGEVPPEELKKEEKASEPENKDDKPDEPADAEDNDDDSADDKSKCSKPDAELSEYCAAFGHEAGAKYFLEGKSFKAAQNEHIKALTAENEEAKKKLAAFATAGVDPVKFSAAADPKREGGETSASGQVDNRAMFTALNKATVEKK